MGKQKTEWDKCWTCKSEWNTQNLTRKVTYLVRAETKLKY
jgi:hypothetical protein